MAITGISGTLTHGSTITISGSGFGTHADYHTDAGSGLAFGWTDFDDVTAFTDGDDIGGGFRPACEDSNCSRDWMLVTTTGRTNSAKWAKRVDWHDPANTCNMHGLKKPYSTGAAYPGTFFVSFWFKIPHTANSGKVLRIWDQANSEGEVIYTDTGGPDGFTYRTWDYNPDGYVFPDNSWIRIDHWKSGSTLRIYILGANSNGIEDSGTISSDGYFQVVLGSGKDQGTPETVLTNFYGYDDFFVDFTAARFELANHATWASVTQSEIQIPTAWADGSVQIQLNIGAFASNASGLYLHRFNTSNVSTDVYGPITLGGGSSPPVGTPVLSVR